MLICHSCTESRCSRIVPVITNIRSLSPEHSSCLRGCPFDFVSTDKTPKPMLDGKINSLQLEQQHKAKIFGVD
jgi:hypothetical protein